VTYKHALLLRSIVVMQFQTFELKVVEYRYLLEPLKNYKLLQIHFSPGGLNPQPPLRPPLTFNFSEWTNLE